MRHAASERNISMKKIDKAELYRHISQFLKTKGVELQDGSYTRRIQDGCSILADTVNLSQQAFGKAKTAMDQRLDRMRQVIHEKTAPKTASAQPTPKAPSAQKQPQAAKPKAARARGSKAKKARAKG
jgi:hypothetical protein